MTDREQKAHALLVAIRYQVFADDGTTMGPCASPDCTGHARGSGSCADCADCLANELDELIDSSAGTNYLYACESQREAERAVLEMAGGGDGRG